MKTTQTTGYFWFFTLFFFQQICYKVTLFSFPVLGRRPGLVFKVDTAVTHDTVFVENFKSNF